MTQWQGIQFKPVDQFVPDPDNARTHSDKQIAEVVASINTYGWTMPILEDDVVRAGNARLEAAKIIYEGGGEIYMLPGKDAGGKKVKPGYAPYVDCSGWTEEQRVAYALADNKIPLNAGWDEERLSAQLKMLQDKGGSAAALLTGFNEKETLERLRGLHRSGKGDADAEGALADKIRVKPGDMFLLGDHKIICGDATKVEVVTELLGEEKPHLMVTDPPYGVEYDADWRNHTGDLGRSARAVGKVENDDRADWSEAWELFPGDVAYVWHAGNMCHIVGDSLVKTGFNIRAQIIWNKSNMVIGRGDYHPKHEPCLYAVRKKAKNARYVGGRKQTTVWDITKPQKSETGHSTQKPVECMLRPIENNSARGDLVYEPFSGSGTTIIACEQSGRACRAVELNPAYVDLAIRRWAEFSGHEAVRSDGVAYDAIEPFDAPTGDA